MDARVAKVEHPVPGYALIYGDEIAPIDGRRVWKRRDELIAALRKHGLKVDRHGNVSGTKS